MTETQKNFCIGEFIISLVLTGLNISLVRNIPESFIQIICKVFCAICALCAIIIVIIFLYDYYSKGKIEHGKKDYEEELYRKQIIKEKNMIDNGIKIGSSKYNSIIVTFFNGRKKISLAAPYPDTNLAILDSYSRYVGADRIDGIGENLDVNYTVTRGKSETSGYCEQFVMIINNSLLQKLLNENGVSVRHS